MGAEVLGLFLPFGEGWWGVYVDREFEGGGGRGRGVYVGFWWGFGYI